MALPEPSHEKELKHIRIIQKHETEANWNKATKFIPKLGEVIIYDPDANHTTSRIKIGDGTTVVANLPFVQQGFIDSELSNTSENAVQNKVIKSELDKKQGKITSETSLTIGDLDIQTILTLKNPEESSNVEAILMSCSSQYRNDIEYSSIDFYGRTTEDYDTHSVILSNIESPEENNQAANKFYVDTEVAKNKITVDTMLSSTSTNPVQNKVINTALSNKLDKFTQPAGVQWNGLLYGVQDDGTTHSIQKMFNLCTDAIEDTVVLRNKQGEIFCETPTVNVTDKHAVNIGYLTTKYGPTNYSSQDQEFYFPPGSNLVIPNTEMGRLFMGSEGARSTDFKIYVNDPIDNGKLIITNLKTPVNDEDAANKSYVDTQVATKQAKFAEYTSTRPSEEAPASASTNILVLNEGIEFYLRDRATNPLVEFKINSSGALEGTTNYFSLTSKGAFNLKSNTFALSNDKGTPFQVVMDDSSKKVVYYVLSGGDDNGSLYLTNTSRIGQQGATLQGNVSSDSRTTALVVNESNTKLLSWKQGTTTNNAPLLGVATPVATADTDKGITADDLDYQAVNKKYVDDIKTELLKAINHPYTYDETTKELTLIL